MMYGTYKKVEIAGLEPAVFWVSVKRFNQLSYTSKIHPYGLITSDENIHASV